MFLFLSKSRNSPYPQKWVVIGGSSLKCSHRFWRLYLLSLGRGQKAPCSVQLYTELLRGIYSFTQKMKHNSLGDWSCWDGVWQCSELDFYVLGKHSLCVNYLAIKQVANPDHIIFSFAFIFKKSRSSRQISNGKKRIASDRILVLIRSVRVCLEKRINLDWESRVTISV